MEGGKTRKQVKYGSRAKVWRGGAEMTSGGLRKDDLMKTKRGRIVSKKRHTRMAGGEEKTDLSPQPEMSIKPEDDESR